MVQPAIEKRREITRRSFLVTGVAGAAGVASRTTIGCTGERPPIILGQVNLSFYAVTGAVVHEVLKRVGHSVEVREGPHEEIFPLLDQDAIDLMAAVWLPEGHAAYWARYGRNAIEVAQLYDGAHFFWAVPNYVPADEVASISDLGKPTVAERMTKLIQGIGSGATISVVSKKALAEYGLEGLGYTFRTGTAAEWIGALSAAMAERRWMIFPTWAPQYLNRENKIRALQDPLGVLGGANHASLVSPRDRFERLPLATRAALSRIKLGIDGVTEMDWLVNVAKQTPSEAARQWMTDNDKRVAEWLKA